MIHQIRRGWGIFLCVAITLWYSLRVLTYARFKKLDRAKVNHLMRLGAQRIMKVIRADYQVHFAPEFQLNPDRVYVFMSNHLSLMDLPLIFALLPGTIRFLLKKELLDKPFFGACLERSEFLPLDREHPETMQALFSLAERKLKDGIWLWIFPEGTRSLTGQLLPFKMGGFRLAREVEALIVPVGIVGTHAVLPPKTFQLSFGHSLHLSVGKPIDTRQFKDPLSQIELARQVSESIRRLCQLPFQPTSTPS